MSQSSHNTANYPSLLVYTATMHTKKKELILSSIFAWSYFFQVFNGFRILVSIFNSGFSREFPLFGAKNKTQSQLSCRLNFSLNCSLVFPIYLPSVPFSQEHQAFLVISAFLLFPQILLPPSSCHLQQCS